MIRIKSTRAICALALLAAVAGCGTTQPRDDAAADDLRFDLTPELYTLSNSWSDEKNQWAVMVNENTRMMREDWDRAMYWDRPSRLTREPVPR